jgi:hypothetical protein
MRLPALRLSCGQVWLVANSRIFICTSFYLSIHPADLDQLGQQFTPVSTLKQHVPSLWNILKLGIDNLLALFGLNLSRLNPAR